MKISVVSNEVPPGAPPDEADAMVQAEAVLGALRELGHEAGYVAFTPDLRELKARLRRAGAEAVFNLVESVEGLGRFIYLAPSYFEILGIPFTGAWADAVYLSTNKAVAKRLMESAGIPTPKSVCSRELFSGRAPSLSGKFIIKSVWEEGSWHLDEENVVAVGSAAELRAKMSEFIDAFGGEWFAEQYVDGREFNVSVIAEGGRPRVLPPSEIVFEGYPPGKPRIVGSRAKWDSSAYEYGHTPRNFDFPLEDAALLDILGRMSLECWNIFGMNGFGRIDFRADASGLPFVLEANTNPCLSPDAGFAAACLKDGISYREMVRMILEDAIFAFETNRKKELV